MIVSPQDFVALNDLYSRYCYHVDQDDAAAIVATFTPDGAFERVNTSAAFPDLKRFEGTEVLTEFFSSWSQGMTAHQHWINNLWFEEGPTGNLQGHASFAILHEAGGVGEILSLGSYRDELVTVDGEWKYLNRYISFLY